MGFTTTNNVLSFELPISNEDVTAAIKTLECEPMLSLEKIYISGHTAIALVIPKLNEIIALTKRTSKQLVFDNGVINNAELRQISTALGGQQNNSIKELIIKNCELFLTSETEELLVRALIAQKIVLIVSSDSKLGISSTNTALTLENITQKLAVNNTVTPLKDMVLANNTNTTTNSRSQNNNNTTSTSKATIVKEAETEFEISKEDWQVNQKMPASAGAASNFKVGTYGSTSVGLKEFF